MISVIIPTHLSGPTIARLLASISRNERTGYELIVVDRFSEDGTSQFVARYGGKFLQGPWNRAEARNAGARVAKGGALVFLDSDMELTQPIFSRVELALESHDAVILREALVPGKNYWSKCRSVERDAYFGSLYFEAARCFRKSFFEQIGGYNPALVGLEDMDLQACVVERQASIAWVDLTVLHHEEAIGLRQYIAKRAFYGGADRLFAARHPSFARVLRSPVARLRAVLPGLRGRSLLEVGTMLPGLGVSRGAEFVVRALVAPRTEDVTAM